MLQENLRTDIVNEVVAKIVESVDKNDPILVKLEFSLNWDSLLMKRKDINIKSVDLKDMYLLSKKLILELDNIYDAVRLTMTKNTNIFTSATFRSKDESIHKEFVISIWGFNHGGNDCDKM